MARSALPGYDVPVGVLIGGRAWSVSTTRARGLMFRSGLAVPPAAERRDGPAASVGAGGNHRRRSGRKLVYLVSVCASLLAIAGLASTAIALHRHPARNVPAHETARGRHQPAVPARSRSGPPPIFGVPSSVLLLAPAAPPRTSGPAPAPRPSPRIAAHTPAPRVSPSLHPGHKQTPFVPTVMPTTPFVPTPMPNPSPTMPNPSPTPSPGPAGSGTP